MSSIGCSLCSSHRTKSARTTTAIPNAATVTGAVHPLSGASMNPYTSADTPTIESSAPSGSIALSSGSRDLGTKNQPPTNATAITGRYTRKADPNQKWPSTHPVTTGPIEPATPVVVAQIAIALARSWGGNTFTRIDNVDGMMNAAPTPITAR